MQFINQTGRDIYSFIDGTRTVEDIYRSVIEKNHEPYGKFRDSVYDFLRYVLGLNHAILSKEKSCADCEFKLSCIGCITRGVREYLKKQNACRWRQENNLKELLQEAVFQD